MSPAQEGPGCMVDGPQGLRGLHPHFGLDEGIALPLSWLSTGTFRSDGTVPCLPHPLYLPLPTWGCGELRTAWDQQGLTFTSTGRRKPLRRPLLCWNSRPGLPSPSQPSGTHHFTHLDSF